MALAGERLDPATGVMDCAADVTVAARALPRPPVLLGQSLDALVVLADTAQPGLPAAGLVLVAPSPLGSLAIAVDPAAVAVPALVLEAARDDAEGHPPGQNAALTRLLARQDRHARGMIGSRGFARGSGGHRGER